jgi:hypothetical protein
VACPRHRDRANRRSIASQKSAQKLFDARERTADAARSSKICPVLSHEMTRGGAERQQSMI